jgi:hypothetical protein
MILVVALSLYSIEWNLQDGNGAHTLFVYTHFTYYVATRLRRLLEPRQQRVSPISHVKLL